MQEKWGGILTMNTQQKTFILGLLVGLYLGIPQIWAAPKVIPLPARGELSSAPPEISNSPLNIQVGFVFDTLLGAKSPYERTEGTAIAVFGSPLPQNISLELALRLLPQLTLGGALGYSALQSRIFYNGTDIDTVTLREKPRIRLFARYEFFNQSRHSLDLEMGAGMGLGEVKLTTTNSGASEVKETQNVLLFEPLLGWNLAWSEHWKLRISGGYSLQKLSQKNLTNALFTVRQAASYSGALMRAGLSYDF